MTVGFIVVNFGEDAVELKNGNNNEYSL